MITTIDLPAVSLADVVATADLQTRVDQKYVVPVGELPNLIAQFEMRVLEIDSLRTFTYESVYFDTPAWTSYLAAARRPRRRFKLRTRTYVDSGAGHRPQSLSKYGVGIAALHPELPRNIWARALRSYVAP